MRYISNTPAQQREMLATIGVGSIEDLLARIPAKARLSRPLNVPAAMAESDLIRHLRRLSAKNANADDFACFLGGGSYDHTIPSPINHLILRGEFFTAYTPYQPEASQGTLRSIFEYQTMMAELTGMDVANASLYDGASAVAEAVLMAHAVTERKAAVISKGVNPLYRQVVETYCEGPAIRLKSAPLAEGVTDLDALRKSVSAQTAAVVVQYPNFFGCLEDVKAAAEIAHAAGALLIVVADPVNLGLLTPPGALGADLVVGEGQGLGVPMSFGGPNLGVFAAKQELVRRMPGRLVGATVDLDGKRGFVLTLQTREHLHQRRPVRPHGHDLRLRHGQGGAPEGRRAVHRQGALRGGGLREDPGRGPHLQGALLQGVRADAAQVPRARGQAADQGQDPRRGAPQDAGPDVQGLPPRGGHGKAHTR